MSDEKAYDKYPRVWIFFDKKYDDVTSDLNPQAKGINIFLLGTFENFS